MNKTRPVNLDLTKIKFPITAIVSIFHRISGLVIFLLLPVLLYGLQLSLTSPHSFAKLSDCFASGGLRFFTWLGLSVVIYHFVAGIRHLFMDAGYGETLKGGRSTAFAVFVVTGILMILMGIWLWR